MSKNTSDQNISSDLTTGLPVFRDAAGKQVDFNTNPKPAATPSDATLPTTDLSSGHTATLTGECTIMTDDEAAV
jgi:hypothetical protein